MKHYEILYLIPATLTEEELVPIKDKVKDLIKRYGGEITLEDSLGKRKLAYPIKKFRQGYYLLVEFNLPPENLNKLTAELHLTGEVLRHTIVNKPESKPGEIKTPAWKLNLQATPLAKAPAEVKVSEKPADEKVKLEELDKKLEEILEGDIF